MERLNRNDSLALLRILVNVDRSVGNKSVEMARMALKNDRQFEEFQRQVKTEQARAKTLCLKACQDLGFVDKTVTEEDLKYMR